MSENWHEMQSRLKLDELIKPIKSISYTLDYISFLMTVIFICALKGCFNG